MVASFAAAAVTEELQKYVEINGGYGEGGGAVTVGGGAEWTAAGGVLGDKSVWLQKRGQSPKKLQRHLRNANVLARRGRGGRQLFEANAG